MHIISNQYETNIFLIILIHYQYNVLTFYYILYVMAINNIK